MLELPEVVTIAQQMNRELKGKQIELCVPGNAAHKFAFYNRAPDEYTAILTGRTIAGALDHGGHVLVRIEPEYVLALGGGGERITFHHSELTLPARHQFLLRFVDGTYLTVSVQMWGGIHLMHQSELAGNALIGPQRVSPVSDAFTYDYFQQALFAELEPADAQCIKYVLITNPGIWGVGNGYVQDILFRARLHPRRKAIDLATREKRALYKAIRTTLKQAVDQGGRDTERDLYDLPGGYRKILDSSTLQQPCRHCGGRIEKIQLLGGTSYFCPHCQPQAAEEV